MGLETYCDRGDMIFEVEEAPEKVAFLLAMTGGRGVEPRPSTTRDEHALYPRGSDMVRLIFNRSDGTAADDEEEEIPETGPCLLSLLIGVNEPPSI